MPPVTPAAATEHKDICRTPFNHWTPHGGLQSSDNGDPDEYHSPERMKTMSFQFRRYPISRHKLSIVSLAVALALGSLGCSDTDRSATRFCGSLNDSLGELTANLATSSDVASLVNRFEKLNGITPLAIEEEWQTLTKLVQLAAKTDPSDSDSRQKLADAAYQTERPARAIERWVEATCGFQMPDVIGLEGPYVP